MQYKKKLEWVQNAPFPSVVGQSHRSPLLPLSPRSDERPNSIPAGVLEVPASVFFPLLLLGLAFSGCNTDSLHW